MKASTQVSCARRNTCTIREAHQQGDDERFAAIARLVVPEERVAGVARVHHEVHYEGPRGAHVDADARQVRLQVAAAVELTHAARILERVAHVQPVRRRRRCLTPEPAARRRHRHVLLGLQRQPVRLAELEAVADATDVGLVDEVVEVDQVVEVVLSDGYQVLAGAGGT